MTARASPPFLRKLWADFDEFLEDEGGPVAQISETIHWTIGSSHDSDPEIF